MRWNGAGLFRRPTVEISQSVGHSINRKNGAGAEGPGRSDSPEYRAHAEGKSRSFSHIACQHASQSHCVPAHSALAKREVRMLRCCSLPRVPDLRCGERPPEAKRSFQETYSLPSSACWIIAIKNSNGSAGCDSAHFPVPANRFGGIDYEKLPSGSFPSCFCIPDSRADCDEGFSPRRDAAHGKG